MGTGRTDRWNSNAPGSTTSAKPPEHDIRSNVVSTEGIFARTESEEANMLKKLAMTTALSGLMMSAALAQAVDTSTSHLGFRLIVRPGDD